MNTNENLYNSRIALWRLELEGKMVAQGHPLSILVKECERNNLKLSNKDIVTTIPAPESESGRPDLMRLPARPEDITEFIKLYVSSVGF